jgi:hypothetical protein
MGELRIGLTGDNAHLGEVAAADVAYLILGIERTMSQAASVILRRPKTTTGRREQVIERAVRLRLRAVEEGSVVPVLEIPDFELPEGETLDLDAASLGEQALELVMDAADPESHPNVDPIVVKALVEVAERLRIGDRYEALTFDAKTDGHRRNARVDREVRQQLRSYVDSAPPTPTREDAIVGTLVEADFEKRTARLRTATEPAVQISFDDNLADDIQNALRHPASFRGDVVYDPKTSVARAVRLQRIERGEQLVLGVDAEEFWREQSFEDLAFLQGAGQPADLDALYDKGATEEERDAFMAAISEL